jgi:hypothetical protein
MLRIRFKEFGKIKNFNQIFCIQKIKVLAFNGLCSLNFEKSYKNFAPRNISKFVLFLTDFVGIKALN